MSNSHEPDFPLGLDSFVNRLGELETVFGAKVAPTLAAVKERILYAMAARDRGDMPAAFRELQEGMEQLARLADELDSSEAQAMRAVAQMFRTALARGDAAEAKRNAAIMFERSGARERKPE